MINFIKYLFSGKKKNLTIATFMIISNGTIFFHFIEGWRWIDSLYFSVITLTTVGYGDFSPQTDLGKIVAIIYILVGIGLIMGFIDAVYSYQRMKQGEAHDRMKKRIDGFIKKRKNT